MSFKDLPLMKDNSKGIMLFYPYVSKKSLINIRSTLNSRWVGEGPKVKIFENKFKKQFAKNNAVISTGSGTDALHLAYLLAGLKKGDEVISTIFTCTATNIPLLYLGCKIKFADVDLNTMNISVESVKKLITKKTKAIVCVHYGGLPCDLDELHKLAKKNNIKIIEDAAQAMGADRCFSYIDDCLSCLIPMIDQKNLNREIINIGPDEEFITINKVAELCSNITGVNLNPIHKEDRPKEVKHATCSADKARNLLNYKTKVSLKEGVEKTFNYIKKRGVRPFNYNINIEINNDLTPSTWKNKEI